MILLIPAIWQAWHIRGWIEDVLRICYVEYYVPKKIKKLGKTGFPGCGDVQEFYWSLLLWRERSRYRSITKIHQNFSTWVVAASEIPQVGNSQLINWVLNLFNQYLENLASTTNSLLFLLAVRSRYCSQPFLTQMCSHGHRAAVQRLCGESQSQYVTGGLGLHHFERAASRSASWAASLHTWGDTFYF